MTGTGPDVLTFARNVLQAAAACNIERANLVAALLSLPEGDLAVPVTGLPSAAVPPVTVSAHLENSERLLTRYWVEKARASLRDKAPARNRAGDSPASNTYRTYDTHWIRLLEEFGDQPLVILAEQAHEFLNAAGAHARATAAQRASTRAANGLAVRRSAGDQAIRTAYTALNHVFRPAVREGILRLNPLDDYTVPRPQRAKKGSLGPERLQEMLQAAAHGGDDPELDLLIIWSDLEMAGRQATLVGLARQDLDRERQVVTVPDDKNGTPRVIPVSLELIDALLAHAARRGSTQPHQPVLCYADSTAERVHGLTGRRYDTLYRRLQRTLPWADNMQLTNHYLRHTAIQAVEKVAGYAVAHSFAGHAEGDITFTYLDHQLPDVAKAVAAAFGFAHPAAEVAS